MTTTAWLIEWPANKHDPVRYWHASEPRVMDPNDATAFARKVDAEAMMKRDGLHAGARAVEHIFGIQRCPTEAEKKAQGAACGCNGADDYCPCQNVVQQPPPAGGVK